MPKTFMIEYRTLRIQDPGSRIEAHASTGCRVEQERSGLHALFLLLPRPLPSFSFPYRKALLSFVLGLHAWAVEGLPSSVPIFLTMSSLTPRRCLQPSVRNGLFSDSSVDDAGFVCKIETRPSHFSSLRGYHCVHITLQPGHLRSPALRGIVESLSMKPLPVSHRLLATWLQSFTTFRT